MRLGWPGELVAIVLGLAVGSYGVTAAIRAARREPSSRGRSHCDGCGVSLSFTETVPILSYVRLGGTCAACGARIDPLHLLGEATGAGVLGAAVLLPDPISGALMAVLGLVLLALSVLDLKTKQLPHALTAVVAILCAALAWRRGTTAMLIGLGFGLGFAVVLQGVRLVRRAAGRGPGLGSGDVKLIAALSLWLGTAAPWMLAGAAVLGLAGVALFRPASRRVPFAPAIAVSAWGVGWMLEAGNWPAI